MLYKDNGLFVDPNNMKDLVNVFADNLIYYNLKEKSVDGYITFDSLEVYKLNVKTQSTERIGEQLMIYIVELNQTNKSMSISWSYNNKTSEYKALKNCELHSFYSQSSPYPGTTVTSSIDCIVIPLDKIASFYNRTYNLHTKKSNSACSFVWPNDLGYFFDGLNICLDPDIQFDPLDNLRDISWNNGPELFVEDLKKNTDYRIDWYTYKEGLYLESSCQNTNGKNFKLKHPQLITTFFDRPILWFVITQENCQKSITQENSTLFFNEEDIVFEGNRCFPNPTTEFSYVISNEMDDLFIFSSTGVLLETFKIQPGKNKIDFSTYSKGIYLIKFSSTSKIEKIIVE